jgi:tetratricopeptide (TPR) repeat protein
MYYAIAAIVLIAAFVAYQIAKPSIQRKAAVRDAVAKARATASNPNDFAAQLKLADVLTSIGGAPQEALAILEKVEAAKPNYWVPEHKPARILVGEAYVAMNQLDKAIEVFQRFVAAVPEYETGGDKEKKWRIETFKVDAEQRIRMLKKGDTHVHAPEQWGDREEP